MRALYLLSATVFAGWTQFPPTVLRFLYLPAAPSTSPTPRQGHKFCTFQAVLRRLCAPHFSIFGSFFCGRGAIFFERFAFFASASACPAAHPPALTFRPLFSMELLSKVFLPVFQRQGKRPPFRKRNFAKGRALFFRKREDIRFFGKRKDTRKRMSFCLDAATTYPPGG